MATAFENNDVAIEQWKLRRTLQYLSRLRGRSTSLITLVVPAQSQLSRTTTLLTEETGLAVNIKSPQTRHNVQQALAAAQGRLRLYTQNTLPPNGLVIYTGIVYENDQHRETKISICLTPLVPVQQGLYRCETHFITDFLQQQLNSNLNDANTRQYGIIVIDGSGTLLARIDDQNGSTVLKRFQVSLPKKHGRGGQSALRFERLRREAIHNYLSKVAEYARSAFLHNGQTNLSGFIISGSANLKQDLVRSDLLGAQIQNKILRLVDVSYGGDNGLHETLRLCSDLFNDIKLTQERELLEGVFQQIHLSSTANDGQLISYAVGVDETQAVFKDDSNLIDRLILDENLSSKRFVYQKRNQTEQIVLIADDEISAQAKLKRLVKETTTNDYECIEQENFLDYLTEHYKQLNINLYLVTDRSPEGKQFQMGFGGCIALLRYPIPSCIFDNDNQDNESDVYDDY